MRLIDADALIIELEKDEALFDNEATVAHENSIKYTDNYAKIMWSRANGIRDAIIEVYDAPTIDAVSVVHGGVAYRKNLVRQLHLQMQLLWLA